MIDQLHAALIAAQGPDRETDCLLHEVLTGQLDQQTNNNKHYPRDGERAHGVMLLDLGSERRRWDVPKYTGDFDKTILLMPADLCLTISMSSPCAIDMAKKYGCIPSHTWTTSIWNPKTAKQVAVAMHNASAALCLCLALVNHAIKPMSQDVA